MCAHVFHKIVFGYMQTLLSYASKSTHTESVKAIFANVLSLFKLSTKILTQLDSRMSRRTGSTRVGDLFLELVCYYIRLVFVTLLCVMQYYAILFLYCLVLTNIAITTQDLFLEYCNSLDNALSSLDR